MINSFNVNENSKILVVGDSILDKYLFGVVERISPEAPVPILKTKTSELRLGGAANVAANIAAMGTKVSLLSICGKDKDAENLKNTLIQKDVKPILISFKREQTISKERIVSNNQQLLRIDDEVAFGIESSSILLKRFLKIYSNFDAVVLSDYGKGTLTDHQAYINACKKSHIPILIDPKGGDFTKYKNSFAITPNLREFEEIVGQSINKKEIVEKAKKLKNDLNLENLIITLGAEGVMLIDKEENLSIFSSEAKQVYDVSGAGDTVIAVLSALVAQNNSVQKSLRVANTAAGIVVGRFGTSIVTRKELADKLKSDEANNSDLIKLNDLKNKLEILRKEGKKIVMTNGCFDILHAGHVDYLKKAKNQGDILIVAINSDKSVRELKGEERPINKLKARSAVISGLKSVDFTISFNATTPKRLYEQLKPDVLVKGSDYTGKKIAGSEAVEANGGRIELVEFLEGYSTTSLIRKITSKP